MTDNNGEKLVKTGAALTFAGCNMILMVPMLIFAGVMLWCAFSLLFAK